MQAGTRTVLVGSAALTPHQCTWVTCVLSQFRGVGKLGSWCLAVSSCGLFYMHMHMYIHAMHTHAMHIHAHIHRELEKRKYCNVNIFLNFIIFILYVWAFCSPSCLWGIYMSGAHRGQMRASDFLELELQAVVSFHVDGRKSRLLKHLANPQN